MSKKLVALLLALALMLTCILAGCGGGNTNTPADSKPAESTPANNDKPAESKDETKPEETKPSGGLDDFTTEVGTLRSETLIVEVQNPTDTPGQFNSHMQGTSTGFGIHQCLTAAMWEMDTVKGEQFGEVAESWTPNADFTEWTVKVREGCKWSDGEDLDAEDVAYTFNMLMENSGFSSSAYTKQVFKSVEATDKYTVKFVMNESFPRLTQKFGVTIYGTSYKLVPEHIYSQQADPSTFKDETPVTAGPYTVKEYDPLGKWALYELRSDWTDTAFFKAAAEHYGITENQAPPKYVWFRVLGDDTTKQMMAINNEVDVMCEVTPEMLDVMRSANPNIACWYNDYPYATSDDPCSKGIAFSQGQGEPYNNPDFRWGMLLLLDFDQVSENIFNGIGRASPLAMLTNTSAMQTLYLEPLLPWLEEFELDLGDGTTFKPWDPDYKYRMADNARAKGYDIPDDEATLNDMFGMGWWKHDEEAGTKLLNKAGLEKVNGVWQFKGQPFKFNMSYIADTEAQAGRGTQAAFNQWQAAGFDCTISSESSATWSTNGGTGDFQISGYWPTGGITKDIYNQMNGWANDLIVPLGEIGSGQGSRWDSQEFTDVLKKMVSMDPESEENYQAGMELVKIMVRDMPFIPFHSGVKFVPTNSTYWSGYPCAENPYNGPWWWWGTFKYIMPFFTSNIG